jgi:hypothetical protein
MPFAAQLHVAASCLHLIRLSLIYKRSQMHICMPACCTLLLDLGLPHIFFFSLLDCLCFAFRISSCHFCAG